MTLTEFVVVCLSGFAAGAINAIAGGGTLVSFPALIALGVPTVAANVTNTVALVPGYLGGAYAQRRDLRQYVGQLGPMAIIAAVGGLIGSVLLVNSSEGLFEVLVPYLILTACALLGMQETIKRRLRARNRSPQTASPDAQGRLRPALGQRLRLGLVVAPAAVYGGYFGAGLGIMLLAVLGLVLDDPLPRINALKSTLSLIINFVAATFFVFSGEVVWDFAAIMAVSSVAGGVAGGKLAGRLSPGLLRAVVVTFGVVVAIKFLL